MSSNFTKIRFGINTLDNYFIRSSIFKSLKSVLPEFDGDLLDIGCGKMPYKEYVLSNSVITKYVGLDIENAIEYDQRVKPDYVWDGITMPFKSESFDCAFGTEVLEHCFDPEIILSEVYRVLKPGGRFFFTVPFLWNLHEVPFDAYRYTPFSLQQKLERVGFQNIVIKAYGGWHSSLGQMLGLWTRRATRPGPVRWLLSIIFAPFIWMLFKLDKQNFGHTDFREGLMIPGVYGIVSKPNS